jgi:hypothetical protein
MGIAIDEALIPSLSPSPIPPQNRMLYIHNNSPTYTLGT